METDEKIYTKEDLYAVFESGLEETGITIKEEYTESDFIAICHEQGINPPSALKMIEDRRNSLEAEAEIEDIINEADLVSEEDDLEEIMDMEKFDREGIEKEIIPKNSALIKYEQQSLIPQKLKERIADLHEKFLNEYGGTLAHRYPFKTDFRRDLDEIMVRFGYDKREGGIYCRFRKDSEQVDVLDTVNTGKDYMHFLTVKNEEELGKSLVKSQPDKSLYTKVKQFATMSPILAGATIGASLTYTEGATAIAGTAAGAMFGLFVTWLLALSQDEIMNSSISKLNRKNSYLWGLLGITFPHIAGKLVCDTRDVCTKLKHRYLRRTKNQDALIAALQPAPYFDLEEE